MFGRRLLVASLRLPGEPGPVPVALEGLDPWGRGVALEIAPAAHDTLIAFLGLRCETCEGFWNELAHPGILQRRVPGETSRRSVRPVIAVNCTSSNDLAAFRRRVEDLAGPRSADADQVGGSESAGSSESAGRLAFPAISSAGAWEQFQVPVYPYLVLVDGSRSEVIGGVVARSFSEALAALATKDSAM